MLDFKCVWEEPAVLGEGPLWVARENAVYWVDIVSRKVHRYALADGAISNKRIFVQLEAKEEGYPDGMTVDSKNCLWLAHFAGSRITRYSPEGEMLNVISMPVPNITSCTFAGADLDTLYITTARHLLNEEDIRKYPLSGSLFSCKPGATGLPTPSFAG